MDHARRRHYREFYDDVPDEPLAVVWGNCQAEALRVLLSGSPTFPLRTVRVPPVHELTPEDLPHLDAVLARTRLVVSQPVRDGYRGLPLGTGEVRSRAGARLVVWPVIRYRGLHPWVALVRHPIDMAAVPPVVPYHDLRILSDAAGIAPVAPPTADGYRAVAARSLAELRAREDRFCDVGVSDALTGFGAAAVHTLNHPGNEVLILLARRVQEAAGAPADADDPGRELLGGIRAPLEPGVLDALGVDAAPRPRWTVDGAEILEPLREPHLTWYADRPEWVSAGRERYAADLADLGR